MWFWIQSGCKEKILRNIHRPLRKPLNCLLIMVQKAILLLVTVVATLVDGLASNDTVNWRLRLYNDMMATSNKNLIPVKYPDGSLTAQLYFSLARIERLDEIAQVLTTFGWISVVWTDELMQWDPADYGGISNMIMNGNEIWIPEIAILNSVDQGSDLSLDTDFRVSIDANGTIFWAPGMRWMTSCKVYLRNFPFDIQTCEVQFISWMYGSSVQNLTYGSPEVNMYNYVSNGEWDITSSKVGRTDLGDYENSVPIVAFQLTLKRRSGYFVLNLIVPALVMSAMALLVFALPPESGEKISLGITVLLSYSVLLLMISAITPRTSETTPILTIYIIIGLGISSVSIFCTVFVLCIHHNSPDQSLPNWVRKWILRVLNYCLCLRQVESNHQGLKTFGKVHPVITENIDKDAPNGSEGKTFTMPNDLTEYLRRAQASYEEEQVKDKNKEDWESVARAIDRFLLIFFTITIVITALAMLGTVFYDTTSGDIEREEFIIK